MSSERTTGIINLSTTLQFRFTKHGTPYDAYEIKRVEIYNSYDKAVTGNAGDILQTIPGTSVTKIDTGKYEYIVDPLSTSGSYFDKIILTPDEGETDFTDINVFFISDDSVCTSGESRIGYAFDNPDFTSNDGWGAIITSDELRYVYAFGNELIAPNAQTITDDTLKWYIDNAISSVEFDFKIKILKRVYKYRPPITETRTDLSGLTEDVDFEYEDAYDFDSKLVNEYLFIKLRKRPIVSVENVIWKDIAGGNILNLTDWMRLNHEKGSIQFFPNKGGLSNVPLILGNSFPLWNVYSVRGNYPDSFYIDYTAGLQNVKSFMKKWKELREIVGKLAAVSLLADYGDGRSPGLASSSVSLAGISESYSTTQSATNALYGARILQYNKELSTFYKKNKDRYSGVLLGAL